MESNAASAEMSSIVGAGTVRGLHLWLRVANGSTMPLWEHSDWTLFRAVQTLQMEKCYSSNQSTTRQERHKRLFENTYT